MWVFLHLFALHALSTWEKFSYACFPCQCRSTCLLFLATCLIHETQSADWSLHFATFLLVPQRSGKVF